MAKNISVVLLILIMLFSCSGNPISMADSGKTAVSDPFAVDGNGEIKLEGLESGKLYTIYALAQKSSRTLSARQGTGNGQQAALNAIGNDTYTFILPEGCTEISFTAADIGLENGGEYRVGEVDAADIAFSDGAGGISIGEGVSEPIYTNEDGSEVYEAFFSIDISAIPDSSRFAVTEVLTHSGSGSANHNFTFVDESGKAMEGLNDRAVLDLAGYETVYIRLYMEVEDSQGDMVDTLYLISPEEIPASGSIEISNPGTYIIEPSSADQYLVVGKKFSTAYGLGVFINNVNARYCDDGKHFNGVFPIAVTDTGVILNIPKHDRDIMFDYDGEATPVHLEEADGEYPIEKIRREEKTFNVPEGCFIFPVLPEGEYLGAEITMTADIGAFCKIGICNSGQIGYGTESIGNGETLSLSPGRSPDYFLFLNPEGKECTFTLAIK